MKNVDKGVIRLPTIDELYNAYDRKLGEPKIEGFISGHYWSSTTYEGYKLYAWTVSFYDGVVNDNLKNNNDYVRCVREYEDKRIEWLEEADNKMSWHEAMKYADDLNKE